MQPNRTSHTAEFLKRRAKALKKETGVPYHTALDMVVQTEGFSNWPHFQNELKSLTAQKLHTTSENGQLLRNCERLGPPRVYFGHRDTGTRVIADSKITGIQYQSDGEIAWHITTWLPSQFSHVHDYWVGADRSFYSIARIQTSASRWLLVIADNAVCQQCQEIANHTNRPVVDMSPAEKRLVLDAITEWDVLNQDEMSAR